jgi:hypothetical protein
VWPEVLDRLQPVIAALHDNSDASVCLEGTRVQLLEDISHWIEEPSSKNIFWLTGVAGTGKTTVAKSVAEIATTLGVFVASFFFSRASNDRRDYQRVIPTIAYQLARHDGLRSSIVASVDENKDVAATSTSIQARKLVFDILRKFESPSPSCMLIILDALDESRKNPNMIHGGDLIPVLLSGLTEFSFVKVLVTSRPEPSIERMFMRKDLNGAVTSLALHRDIDKDLVRADIARYLDRELGQLRELIPGNPDFPGERDFHVLVERADTLFIYARTVIEYVSDPYGEPDARLSALIEADPERSSGKFGRLDALYSKILDDADKLSNERDNALRRVLVTLALLKQELPVGELAVIAGVGERLCLEVLRRISALLNYQYEMDEPVRLMHLSFSDFLSDRERCTELPKYVVDVASDHLYITEQCLGAMIKGLRKNICNIQDPHLSHTDIVDLPARVSAQILMSLRYSTQFWIVHWLAHIHASGTKPRVPKGLIEFCDQHLLPWIEVLSLTGKLKAIQPLMLQLIGAVNVRFWLWICS